MRVITARLFFVALCTAVTTEPGIVTLFGSLDTLRIESGTCPEYTNVVDDYRDAMYNFTIETFKHTAPGGSYHFIVSSHSMWMTLAAVAEGADPANQEQLFELLRLPKDLCRRAKYYQLAASRFSVTTDANVASTRALVIDEGVTPNPKWHNFVTQNSLLEVFSAPIKQNPEAAAYSIKQVVSANFPNLNLYGNSVLLDTMDYSGLWTTAFTDAVVTRAPFYSLSGEHIGAVDLMRVKRRGKIGFVSSLQSKVLELPIGTKGQYSLIVVLVFGDTDLLPIVRDLKSSSIAQALASLKETEGPIDIFLPQFTLNTELDAKALLEDLGVTNLWTDPEATRYISYPPAWPSSYVQRSTMTLSRDGVYAPLPTLLRSYGSATSPEDYFWREFKADRPFMFGLFDTETYTCLMANLYTQPTYPK